VGRGMMGPEGLIEIVVIGPEVFLAICRYKGTVGRYRNEIG